MDLEDWVRGVQPRIVGLELAGLTVDFSRESLADLALRASDDQLDDESFAEFAAYFGESLMRVAGGRWIEIDARPAVTADPALGLPALVPAELLPAKTENDFTEVYDRWAEAVTARQAGEPGWQPVKDPTPGLDPEPVAAAAPLESWLAEREADFPGWVKRHAPDGTWDFSAGSLPRLAERLIRLIENDDALDDPRHHDLVDGAAWYLGETFRRAGDGQWAWAGESETPGPYVANAGTAQLSLYPTVQLRIGMVPDSLTWRCESLRS